ncbi:bifunctional hydroxymethylpyrimidine kinase/phosphomethylpyrimidine kinase [Saccharopolyspora taberi]|uniref:Bifunctional hydroxymethylpyrimidine kinase/phosphomethylpyrimidine kinase n=1 Tax=Saccharopolyspora taberi TaxID=60895 RepID=A0ABN3V026_9PSEU
MIPAVLTIAGSDPSGGAGMQADLKVISALGGYGCAAVTALTVQNTLGVFGLHTPPPAFVSAQVDAVLDDVRVDAVKIGMLATAATVAAVADSLARHPRVPVVLDPVMLAKSQDRLLAADAVDTLRRRLLPLVDLITPNLPEAAELLGTKPAEDEDGMRDQLRQLAQLGPRVLLKGGHLDGPDCVDLLRVDGEVHRFTERRVETTNTHGTGCALSAAIATRHAHGSDWPAAVGEAKSYLTGALRGADDLDIGAGHGPPDHFHGRRSAT